MTITSRPLGRQKFSVVVGQTTFTPIQPVVALGGSGTYTYTMSTFTLTAVAPPYVPPTGGGSGSGDVSELTEEAVPAEGGWLLKANTLLGADPILVPSTGTETTDSLLPIRIVESTGVVIITSITHLTVGVYEANITVTDGTSTPPLVQKFTLEVLATSAPYTRTISLSGANYSALNSVQSATLVNAVCEQILAENTSITIYYVNLSEGSVILAVGSSGPFVPLALTSFNLGGGIVLTNAIPTNCRQVSVSSSGQYQTIITTNSGGPGFIYRSINFGASWASATGAPSANWQSLSMSADGQYQTAGIGGGFIYRSANYGASWASATGAPSANWYSLSMSADGQYQTAGMYGGFIYRSINFGASWASATGAPSAGWLSLSMSASGQFQTACIKEEGPIYRSTNYGATWAPVPATEAPSAFWSALSMSASGQYQTACVDQRLIYVSTNYGTNWEALPGSPTDGWQSVGMSSDGQYQTAVGDLGVYTWTNVICLLETCNLMLTDGSYKNVKDIKTGDILRSALNGKDIRVLHCGYNVVHDLSRVPASNHPMCIPEGFFAKGSPSRDVFISGHHRLFFALNETTVGIQVFKLLPETNTLTMDKALEVVGSSVLKYYHLEVEGGKNAVFCDGLPVETLEAGEWESSRIDN